MSIIDEVLLEEYERSLRISRALEEEIASLPKGSIQIKHINGREYHYLQFREGKKIVSRYVADAEVDALRESIRRRREDIAALREQRESQRKLIRALGKGRTDVDTAQ